MQRVRNRNDGECGLDVAGKVGMLKSALGCVSALMTRELTRDAVSWVIDEGLGQQIDTVFVQARYGFRQIDG